MFFEEYVMSLSLHNDCRRPFPKCFSFFFPQPSREKGISAADIEDGIDADVAFSAGSFNGLELDAAADAVTLRFFFPSAFEEVDADALDPYFLFEEYCRFHSTSFSANTCFLPVLEIPRALQ
jgi:hypothetical protein